MSDITNSFIYALGKAEPYGIASSIDLRVEQLRDGKFVCLGATQQVTYNWANDRWSVMLSIWLLSNESLENWISQAPTDYRLVICNEHGASAQVNFGQLEVVGLSGGMTVDDMLMCYTVSLRSTNE